MDQNTENVLLSAWSHPLLTELTGPHPPAAPTDPLRDVEMVKEEVVVVGLPEDELEEVEEAVIGQEVSAVGGDERPASRDVDG